MPAQVVRRKQASASYTAGSKSIIPLGRGMIYREIMLNLKGSISYTAAADNAAGTLGRGDEWSAIDRIDLVANGTDIIRSFYGWQLPMLNRLLMGNTPRPNPLLGRAATTTIVPIHSTAIIPLWMPLAAKPMDTALDSSMLSDLRLEITWNSLLGINKTTAPASAALTLDVYSNECYGISGQFSDCRMYNIQAAASTNAALQISLPVTALYRGLLINVADGALSTSTDKVPWTLDNGAAPAAVGVTNVKVKSGTHVYHDMDMLVQRDWQLQRLGWAGQRIQSAAASSAPDVVGGGVTVPTEQYLRDRHSALANADAWTFLDFCSDGYLAEGIDAVGLSELYLELACTLSSGTITVIPIQVFPRRKAK